MSRIERVIDKTHLTRTQYVVVSLVPRPPSTLEEGLGMRLVVSI